MATTSKPMDARAVEAAAREAEAGALAFPHRKEMETTTAKQMDVVSCEESDRAEAKATRRKKNPLWTVFAETDNETTSVMQVHDGVILRVDVDGAQPALMYIQGMMLHSDGKRLARLI